ncbi:RICIN domain-containing protein [Microbacterium sp. NPDC077184]|uniref:RICIN domain-containing protein n=1 Tax=Microbacterium sp. NPDC077184 TaxID=3154764 RepID=UPI0034341E9D
MSFAHRRARRGIFAFATAAAVAVGFAFAAAPSSAAPLLAIEPFDATTTDGDGNDFPAEALLGERVAFASDELLLSTTLTDNSYRRVTDDANTGLATLAQPDPRGSSRELERTVLGARTAAGNLTGPFAERSLLLAATEGLLDGDGREPVGILQLTSTSDVAEPIGTYTTYASPEDGLEPGKTYIIRNHASSGDVIATSPNAAPPVYAASNNGAEKSDLTQQWTAIAHEDVADDAVVFQLVNRADGTCLTQPIPFSNPWTAVCNDSEHQRWRLIPQGDGGSMIFNWSHGQALRYDGSGFRITTSAFGSGAPFEWDFVAVDQPDAIPASTSFEISAAPDAVFDLAVADLDGVAGAEGLGRDEAVVAYVKPDSELALAVVDYNVGLNRRLVTIIDTAITPGRTAAGAMLPLAVDTADVDQDGTPEIIVAYVDDAGTPTVFVAEYTASGEEQRALTRVDDPQALPVSLSTDQLASADMSVYDFDGDGLQEIAWVGPDAADSGYIGLAVSRVTLSGDDLTVSDVTRIRVDDVAYSAQWENANSGVRVESGQFFDTVDGSGSRQLAITHPAADGGQAVTVARLLNGELELVFPEAATLPALYETSSVSMAVGGFAGGGGGDDAQWGIALSRVGGEATDDQLLLIQPTDVNEAPTVNTQQVTVDGGETLAVSGFDLTSYDPGGKTLELGDPVVFTVQKLTSMSLIGGQPPGHSDWIDGEFLNISRNQDFNLEMGTSGTGAFNNETSQQSNQAYNLSAEADVKATIDAGIPFLEKGEVSTELSGKLGASWSSLGSATAQAGYSTDFTISSKTGDDDIVNAMVQDYQVTRYPVISVDSWDRPDAASSGCDDGCYGYWDVVVPGTPQQADLAGKGNDYFTASWQNGNALSYPRLVNGQVPIDDVVGQFTSVAADGTTTTGDASLFNEQIGVGGTETSVDLTTTVSGSSSTSETSEKGWNLDLNVEGGVEAKVGVPFVDSVDLEGSLSAGFSTNQMFTGSTSGSTANTHSTTFALSVPEVDADLGYEFGAAYYYGLDGAVRVTYGTDLTANAEGREFWTRVYGQKPDPALNMPGATVLVRGPIGYLGTVEWVPLDNRQELRGFTPRLPDSDDPTTSGVPYGSSPEVGDPVVFDVEVSNYSLVPITDPLTVSFSAVPIDANNTIIGDPVDIGTTTVTSDIAPQESLTVSSPQWTAQGAPGGGAQSWRVFVVLDEDDTIDEIHGWAGTPDTVCPADSVQGDVTLTDPRTGEAETLVCGQNNQGFGLVSVVPEGAAGASDAQVGFVGAGVITTDAATLDLDSESELPEITVGETAEIVLKADAERDTASHEIVTVYDGHPSEGDIVAVKRLGGLGAEGLSSAVVDYTAPEAGTRELYAVLRASDNTSDERGLIVRVNAVDDPAPGDGDGSDGDGSGSGGDSGDGEGAGSGTPGDGPAEGDAQNDADLATTGAEAWPWIFVAVAGILLVVAGAIARARRPRSD